MKKLIFIFAFIILLIQQTYSQTMELNYSCTTIDSFNITQAAFYQGVTGLDAIEDGGVIHLSYLYCSNAGTPALIYMQRTASGTTTEEITTLDVPYVGYSAIQLDENKNPWVYLSSNFKIFCYKRSAKGWTSVRLDSLGALVGITCCKNGTADLGIFYWYIHYPEQKWELRHTYWSNESWNIESVYEEGGHTGGIISPIIFNNIPYAAVTYVIPPDSTYCTVFAKNGKGWNKDLSYLVGTGYSNIGDQALLGISNNGYLHLWQKSFGTLANYHIKTGSGWQKVISAQSGMGSFFKSKNLCFSAENYSFSISSHAGFAPTVNWRSPQGEYGSSAIPYHQYPYGVELCSFLITPDNTGHIFLISGGVPGSYGDPSAFMTFKEITFNAGEVLTGIDEAVSPPSEFKLYQNYPNPFNPTTTIKYSIPPVSPLPGGARGGSTRVTLKIYDFLGQEIITLVNKEQIPGFYSIEFNTVGLASGVYFYQLRTNDFSDMKKMIVLK